METLEVHSKNFLVKWVHAPDNCAIDWQVKPLKKSINFAIYRKKDEPRSGANSATTTSDDSTEPTTDKTPTYGEENEAPASNSSGSSPTSYRNGSNSISSVNNFTDPKMFRTKSRSSSFSSNISSSDLTLLKDYNKLLSNELVHGTFEVTTGGMFAFIFDNSFSKTTGKKVFFSSKITKSVTEPSLARRKSSVAGRRPPPSASSLTVGGDHKKKGDISEDYAGSGSTDTSGTHTLANGTVLRPKNGELLSSVLSKRRRKKLQGFVKRFFVLNFKYGTLSYFRVNDNKLRGQMPIKQSIVSANPKTRQIIIDSGMEIWDLKALNNKDFDVWVEAFNQIKKGKIAVSAFKSEEDEEEDVDTSVVEELESVSLKLDRLKLDTSFCSPDVLADNISAISKDVHRILARLKDQSGDRSAHHDLVSVVSTNEFYDANDSVDALSSGVVLMDLPNDNFRAKHEEFEEDDDDHFDSISSSSSSSEESGAKYSKEIGTGEDSKGTEDSEDDLYPLPHGPVKRTSDIPVCNHTPTSIISFIRKNVGKDLSTIAMPVDTNEPISALQKYSEMFEYSDLITNALDPSFSESSGEKILRIAAFAVSYFSSVRAKIRNVRKPFNPLLGETFELVREDFGIRVISEKVCHRPGIFAFHAESAQWTFDFSPLPSQKIWGHSAEIITKGTAKLTIKNTGEIFTWTHPSTLVKNILAGEQYSEPSSTMTIKSTSGYKAVVEFAKSGMFSGRSEDLTITAYDANKKKLAYSVSGKWTESLTLKTNTTEKLIWEVGKLLPNYKKKFGFTEFTGTLNKITEIEDGKLAPTDSRLRPDIKLYEDGKVQDAESKKIELEEDQRTRRKELETSGREHVPSFFKQVGREGAEGEWVYIKGDESYWSRRKRGDWSGVLKLW